jgi:hypothetical protein
MKHCQNPNSQHVGNRGRISKKQLAALAEYLWTEAGPFPAFLGADQPLEKRDSGNANADDLSAQFKSEFTLRRADNPTQEYLRRRFFERQSDALRQMWVAKRASDFAERERARARRKAGRVLEKKTVFRQFVIDTAWFFPFEEWVTIFPDAALADDYDFIQKIVRQHRDKVRTRVSLFPAEYQPIAFFWHGFESVGLAVVPPLKYWSDKAAREFVRFMNQYTEKGFEISRYKKCKSRLHLRSETPVLVSRAEYVCDGGGHTLKCWR